MIEAETEIQVNYVTAHIKVAYFNHLLHILCPYIQKTTLISQFVFIIFLKE